MIKNRTPFSEKEITMLQSYATKKSKIIFLCFSILFLALGVLEMIVKDYVWGIYCLIFGVLFCPLYMGIQYYALKKYLTSLKLDTNHYVNEYTFNDDSMTVTTLLNDAQSSQVNIQYSTLYKIVDCPDTFLLFLSNVQAYIVKKDCFIDGTSADLSILFQSHCSNYKIQKRKTKNNIVAPSPKIEANNEDAKEKGDTQKINVVDTKKPTTRTIKPKSQTSNTKSTSASKQSGVTKKSTKKSTTKGE